MKHIALTFSMLLASTSILAQPRYDYSSIQLEDLGRGVVCINEGDSTAISWRLLKDDQPGTCFNVYRNGKRLNAKPLSAATFMKVPSIAEDATYEVRTVDKGKESGRKNGTFVLKKGHDKRYLSIPLNVPEDDTVSDPNRSYRYSANDASCGDVDGDGEYEIILKWEAASHDNSHEGITSPVLLDCYKLNGKHMWRINLGRNIRAGAHYTQFMVYDFDGDGKAEIVAKTADGTIDGQGNVIGDANANYVYTGTIPNNIRGKVENGTKRVVGRILEGPEYLTIFNGENGKAISTVDYIPARGNVGAWGDTYGNRVDRFLACVAYLDGKHPSVVMCRGYYTRSVIAAWDFDGKTLKNRWVFDSDVYDKEHNLRGNKSYEGQGNHNLRVADVDGDGCDEITYGSMAIDHDGKGLYNTGMGHGDALHQMAFYPDSTTLQVWDVHENKRDGSDFRDARTGRVIFQIKSRDDVGRGMAADIDPTNYGLEMWSASQPGYFDVKGNHHDTNGQWIPQNSAVWWDGDLLRELLDKESVLKYDWEQKRCNTLYSFRADNCAFNNGTKQNPCLSADILGDWREEVIVRTRDSKELRIYTTTIPTQHRFATFMHDIPYRISVATENVSYNQPPEPGFYFGSDMK